MIHEYAYGGAIYVFTNDGLVAGDEVHPISRGMCKGDKFEHHYFDLRDFMCGFPDDPHTIIDLHHSDYKPYQCRTSHGFGPIEKYFKVVEVRPMRPMLSDDHVVIR